MSVLNKETLFRVLSAVIALPILFYVLITDHFNCVPILIGTIFISSISLYEYYMIANKEEEGRAFIKTGLLFGILVNVAVYLFAFGKLYGYGRYIGDNNSNIIMGLILLFVAVIMALQLFTRPLKGGTYSIAITLFGVMFIALSASHFILLKSLKDGIFYIITLMLAVMLNDSGAYFGGNFFGKHKLGFEVSPNKSWEGYFSGLLFSVIGFVLMNQVISSFFSRDLFTMLEAVLLGIGISVLADIGDLVESAIKRDGGIKDSGSIIPGHGGMWDVFDAILFTLPFFYYYLLIKGIP